MGTLGGGIDAFSFSFTVPTFVGDGQSPAFTPFSVTDGTHVWTMINDLAQTVSVDSDGAFAFDNGGTSSIGPDDAIGVYAPPDGAIVLALLIPFPVQTGVYTVLASGLFDFTGGTLITNPTGTLDITAVPEPRTDLLLLSVAVAAFGWRLRKRFAKLNGAA